MKRREQEEMLRQFEEQRQLIENERRQLEENKQKLEQERQNCVMSPAQVATEEDPKAQDDVQVFLQEKVKLLEEQFEQRQLEVTEQMRTLTERNKLLEEQVVDKASSNTTLPFNCTPGRSP